MSRSDVRAFTRAAAVTLSLITTLSIVVLAQKTGPVSNPSPSNGATNVSTTPTLSWSPGSDARRYDIRFGTSNPPPIVARNYSGTSYQPGTLTAGATYYWQVDSRGKANDVTPGPLWSFTTVAAPPAPPGVPANVAPSNGAMDVAVSTGLTWSAAANATGYDVAFGTANPPSLVASNQATTSYTPATALAHATTYYWQITAKGPGGSTTGPLWSFTTVSEARPPQATLEQLRVMSWNIRMGMNNAGSMDVDEQVALIAATGAHIILLQEVMIYANRDLRVEYQSKLEAATGKEWHSVWSPSPRNTTAPEGNLALSSLPILASSTLQIDTTAGTDSTDTERSAVQITVDVNGVVLNVFGTHLPLNATHRRSHIDTLLSWVQTFPAPRLFGGDFNMLPGTTEHGTMSAAFADVWPLLAFGDEGFTMDARASAGGTPGRIDYWWQEKSDTQARATEIWVIKTLRSDHHALLIDVDVRPQ